VKGVQGKDGVTRGDMVPCVARATPMPILARSGFVGTSWTGSFTASPCPWRVLEGSVGQSMLV
jgi:hypothetical protein